MNGNSLILPANSCAVGSSLENIKPGITQMNVSQFFSDSQPICYGYEQESGGCAFDGNCGCSLAPFGSGLPYSCGDAMPGGTTPGTCTCLIGTTMSTYTATATLTRVAGGGTVGDYNFSLEGYDSGCCSKTGACSTNEWRLSFGGGETVTVDYSNYTESFTSPNTCTASNVTGSTTGTDTNDANIFYLTRNNPTTGICEFQWGVTWGDSTTTYTAWDSNFEHVLDGFSLSRAPYNIPGGYGPGSAYQVESGTVTVSFS